LRAQQTSLTMPYIKKLWLIERGEAKWKYLFFPWFEHKGYAEKIPKKEMPVQWTEVEEDLREEYDLSDEQLWWAP
jgi:hypothetical protein